MGRAGGADDEVETADEVETSRRFAAFDVVLGADVVHERGMAQGVARMLGRHLGGFAGRGGHRQPRARAPVGAADLPRRWRRNGLSFVSARVTSAMLRSG